MAEGTLIPSVLRTKDQKSIKETGAQACGLVLPESARLPCVLSEAQEDRDPCPQRKKAAGIPRPAGGQPRLLTAPVTNRGPRGLGGFHVLLGGSGTCLEIQGKDGAAVQAALPLGE